MVDFKIINAMDKMARKRAEKIAMEIKEEMSQDATILRPKAYKRSLVKNLARELGCSDIFDN